MLTLPLFLCRNHSDIIPSLMVKWKNLEFLSLGDSSSTIQILEHICSNLPNLSGLSITDGYIDHETALAIVSLAPKLKYLVLEGAELDKENLVLILQGCKQLVKLDVRNCIGFDADDEDISKLASGIKNFLCAGSIAEQYSWEDHGWV